jgi:hypothetical protein
MQSTAAARTTTRTKGYVRGVYGTLRRSEMPADGDRVLYGPYNDNTLMRNAVYRTARRLGERAPWILRVVLAGVRWSFLTPRNGRWRLGTWVNRRR